MDSDKKLYKNVHIGENSQIGEFVIIGVPPKGKADGELKTVIGDNAVIRSHSVIYAGSVIGDDFSAGHGALVRDGCNIGNKVSIGSHSVIEFSVHIEDGVRIHSNAFIPEFSVLKEGCWIGPCVCLTNAKFPLGKQVKDKLKGVYIAQRAKIGAHSVILPGVRVGENALVGAGSVVTKDVPDHTVVMGSPARVHKRVDELQYHDKIKPY